MLPGEQKSRGRPNIGSRRTGAVAMAGRKQAVNAAAGPGASGEHFLCDMAGQRLIHIVGIGASAGGLEAFERFFHACPADTGIAFVLVPHLDPDHRSWLTEILQRTTRMPVAEAAHDQAVEADHVYVVPPNHEMRIGDGRLQLSAPTQARGQRMPIDTFFQSLAAECAGHAIGIVLSGTATDGTLGLRAIFDAGGVCLVQEPATAKYEGMPESAITAGCATHIVAVEKMPALLCAITRQSGFR